MPLEDVDQPVGSLRAYLSRMHGYRLVDYPAGRHIGLPSPGLTLVLAIGAPVRVARMPRLQDGPRDFWALVGGLNIAPAVIAHDGYQCGIQLRLTPLGARARFTLLQAQLRRWLAPGSAARPELVEAWRRITTAGGDVRVEHLAKLVGWSRRHLSGQFIAEYGVSPKELARVVRFERAQELLRPGGGTSLAQVAATVGYADQSHLSREWRRLAGLSPTALLEREVFPFVQDESVDDAAG